MCSCGTALVSAGQAPVVASGNTMCARWFALSRLFPSQQLAKSRIRITLLPAGHSGYLSVVTLLVNPVQLHAALALATPFVPALASPVMIRRNCGIAVTLLTALPRNCSVAVAGC